MATTTETTNPPNFSSPKQADSDELASTKLWAVYISEAEKYDKALVEGWKSDMEGLLIFAGLFSASLTAFLIESYKTLTPDQGAMTIALLAQISRQLNPASNTTSMALTNSSFTPSSSSVACNTLWFLSLGFSLSCALIATLVEQWARDFIQRTEMRPSPVIHARILSYLYFGMQRFGMHTMVEFIPLLLHVSLVLFFAGLLAFLMPINPVLMFVAAGQLGLILVIYLYLTVLPIISSDSPYRTPLSNVVWGLFQHLATLDWQHRSPSDEESRIADHKSPQTQKISSTMVEEMNRAAIMHSSRRDKRDARAIIWTLKSLVDNNELQPFVEALPDLIWGANGRQQAYDHIISMLLENSDIGLVQRIESLLRTCDSGLLHSDHEMWRRITCIRALWAIAYFLVSDTSSRNTFPVFDTRILSSQLLHPHPVRSHAASTIALVEWVGFCAVSQLVRHAFSMLADSPVQDPRTILAVIIQIEHEAITREYVEFASAISRIISRIPDNTLPQMHQLCDTLGSFEDRAYDSLVNYMQYSASLDEMPYEFMSTCEIIHPSARPSTMVRTKLENALITMIHQDEIHKFKEGVHQIDVIVDTILYLLQLDYDLYRSIGAASPIASYMTVRLKPSAGFSTGLRRCNPVHLCSMLIEYLASGRGILASYHTLYAIWSLPISSPQFAVFDEQSLAVVCASCGVPILPCVIAVLKSHILTKAEDLPQDQVHTLMERLQIMPLNDLTNLRRGYPLILLIEFLEQIVVPVAVNDRIWDETFEYLANQCPRDYYPPSFQRRFAAWLASMFNSPSMGLDMVRAVVGWLFDGSVEYFDDMEVQQRIIGALENLSQTWSQDPSASVARQRAAITIARLKSPHNQTEHMDLFENNAISKDSDSSLTSSENS